MLPTPCTVADQHAGSPRRPPGRSGMLRPADNGRAWHRQVDKRPAWGYPYHHLPCQRNPRKGKGRPSDPEGLSISLSRSPLFFRYNLCFPLAYKRESRASHEGGLIRLKPINRDRHKKHDTSTRLSSNRALSTRSLLSSEIWDHFPLSLVCTPYYKLSVLVTRAAATNWM